MTIYCDCAKFLRDAPISQTATRIHQHGRQALAANNNNNARLSNVLPRVICLTRPYNVCTSLVPGSTPQVTFPPGAGHDRYEENFNGPATYAEPYVERYGIKSDFSGREPLHPTPPRPGYVPTLGQTPPSSTQGSVMMVYGLQPDKVNTDKLFNLFCLYGNVTKVGCVILDLFLRRRCLLNVTELACACLYTHTHTGACMS